MTESSSDKSDATSDQKGNAGSIELTESVLGEMLERTFLQACFQLPTGFVDMLKLFLVATTAAYQRPLSLARTLQLVNKCPVNTANRDLTTEEIELRTSWISIGYLTLWTLDQMEGLETVEALERQAAAIQIPQSVFDDYGALVQHHVATKLGQAELEETSSSSTDPQTAALRAYQIKIIQLTLQTIHETRLANEKFVDEDGVGPPRPHIPGAFEP
eukprot:CAMPEP_0172446466 /NCGR_PEP_ID=MMETSP1065-20121228/6058_1 /TAXON_ID=265537 /ORGANISM="Amphiprora paludosa, Strain CCMP125" /LENGTH=215 /DNA_ID=CAMNT_0013197593 /DNA_START=147 /DNA_END=794 /DNA_ORIENTATION=+